MRKILGLVVLGSALAGASASLLAFPVVVARHLPTASLTTHQTIAAQSDPNVASPSPDNRLTDRYPANRNQKEVPKTENAARFQRITEYAVGQNLHDSPMGEIVQAIAVAFLGTPYKAGLLDQSSQETLVVTLNKFDCVLFVETVLAIARGVAVQDYSYQTFVDRIRDQRYWNGYMNGYCSRLHYFSEWIADNQRRGSVQNITRSLGGVALNKKLNFMSQHRGSYPQLVSHEANYKCIVAMEANLAKLTINYIPQSQIRRVYAQLQPGDIVAIATNITGIDVTHTGLVYRHPNGNIGLIHASPIGKVTISLDLQRYVGNIKNASGIIVARPIDPRQTTPANKL